MGLELWDQIVYNAWYCRVSGWHCWSNSWMSPLFVNTLNMGENLPPQDVDPPLFLLQFQCKFAKIHLLYSVQKVKTQEIPDWIQFWIYHLCVVQLQQGASILEYSNGLHHLPHVGLVGWFKPFFCIVHNLGTNPSLFFQLLLLLFYFKRFKIWKNTLVHY